MLKPELLPRGISHAGLLREFQWPKGCAAGLRDCLQRIWKEFDGPVVFDSEVGIVPDEKGGFEGQDGAVSVEAILAPSPGPLDMAKEVERMALWGCEGFLPFANAPGGCRFGVVTDDERIYLWLSGVAENERQLFVCAQDAISFFEKLERIPEKATGLNPLEIRDSGLDALFAASRRPTN